MPLSTKTKTGVAVVCALCCALLGVYLWGRLIAPGVTREPRDLIKAAVKPSFEKSGERSISSLASQTPLAPVRRELPAKPSLSRLEDYVDANGRIAASLLAAYRISGQVQYLKEAVEKYPSDLHVAFAAVFQEELSPEDRRKWLENFKQTDPNNPLGNYLSAWDYFKSERIESALVELASADGKGPLHNYASDFEQTDEAVFRAMGYGSADASWMAESSLRLRESVPLHQLGQSLADLLKQYQSEGDTSSATAATRWTLSLARQLSGDRLQYTLSTLIGLTMEKDVLGTLDPAAAYDQSGQSSADRLAEIEREGAEINRLNRLLPEVLASSPDEDITSFYELQRSGGPVAAMRWIFSKTIAPSR